jgi:hypothetical protein
VRKLSIKLHEKRPALDSIGRHLGMFVERHEVTVKHLDAFLDAVATVLTRYLPPERARVAVLELAQVAKDTYARSRPPTDAGAA